MAPATDKARRTELALLALEAASLGAVDEPAPIVQEFGTPDDLLIRQIEMLHSGCGDAIRRVTEAALDESEWAASRLYQALTEALLWIRLVDGVLDEAWRATSPRARETASQRTDAWLSRLLEAEPERARTSAALRAYEKRLDDGHPYANWATAAIGSGVTTREEEFDALTWLAVKLLHLAPRPVVELRHWRLGAQPRWKWRPAANILPKAQDKKRNWSNRDAYERYLAGRDVIGSLNLTMTLIEVEYMFVGLRRTTELG